MKTISDLNAIIPAIIEKFEKEEHQIGESYYEPDEDGWGRCDDYTDNYFVYEEDGWFIEVSYKCCGDWIYDSGDYWTPPSRDLRRAWGEVTEISVCHYDDDTDEESVLDGNDLAGLWCALDKSLEKIA